MFPRYLAPAVADDLSRKMVFVGGPRQVGKTSLGRVLVPDPASYLNFDVASHREAIFRRELPPTGAWFFDEIHKYRQWRNFLKGLWDSPGPRRTILVTGSARLDYYRFGGDSLQGRYYYLRLHPFSLAELNASGRGDLLALLHLSGFPEPFLSGSESEARRWSLSYRERLVREDITDLENVSDLSRLELLVLALADRVGSPLSLNGLREDLKVSHPTVSRWVEILERLYGVFRLAPFGAPRLRAVKKEQKHYHFDWTIVRDLPARFENLVASHLLKWCHYQVDTQGRDIELRYYRDTTGREVDFVLTENGSPIGFVECKWDDAALSPGLAYLHERFPTVPAWQVSAVGRKDYVTPSGVRVAPAGVLLRELV